MSDTITTTPLKPVTIKVEVLHDDYPDLSWLEQTDEETGRGFEKYAIERLNSFGYTWHMIGINVTATTKCACGEATKEGYAGLWGIESDSGNEYLKDEVLNLIAEAMSELNPGHVTREANNSLTLHAPEIWVANLTTNQGELLTIEDVKDVVDLNHNKT